ncbi:MAG: hypothetical protein ONB23_09335 [candidate division KSB1 bacterium]|nr:hypothetical protein [candidate division KSB1 bacterium]
MAHGCGSWKVGTTLVGAIILSLLIACASPTDPQERYDGEWYGTLTADGEEFVIQIRVAYDRIDRVVIAGYEERVLYPLGNEIEGDRFKVYLSDENIWVEGLFRSDRQAEGTFHAYGAVYSWTAIKVRTKNGTLLVPESFFWEPHVRHLQGSSRGKLLLEKVNLEKMLKHRYQLWFRSSGPNLTVYIGDLSRQAYIVRGYLFSDSLAFEFDGIRLTLINDWQYPFTADDVYEFWYE